MDQVKRSMPGAFHCDIALLDIIHNELYSKHGYTMPNVRACHVRYIYILVHLVNLVIHFFIGHIPGASPSTSSRIRQIWDVGEGARQLSTRYWSPVWWNMGRATGNDPRTSRGVSHR